MFRIHYLISVLFLIQVVSSQTEELDAMFAPIPLQSQRFAKHNTVYKKIAPCLDQTTAFYPPLPPKQLQRHYKNVLNKTAIFRNARHHQYFNHTGGFLEEKWIESFIDTPLEEFNGFVPLFIDWTNMAVRIRYPENLKTVLASVLRDDVMYVTVSQHAKGIALGKYRAGWDRTPPNIFIFSSGGNGHVPVPHLWPENKSKLYKLNSSRMFSACTPEPLVSMYGYVGNGPVRKKVHKRLQNIPGVQYTPCLAPCDNWHDHLASCARFVVAPRGYGRTSFFLYEIFEHGKIPLYVYLQADLPWLPYVNIAENFMFVSSSDAVDKAVATLQSVSNAQMQYMNFYYQARKTTHFTISGILHQIMDYLNDGTENDLVCQELPPTMRGSANYAGKELGVKYVLE